MDTSVTSAAPIPVGLVPHFQEYDAATLDLQGDADLIMQRTLEYGTWEEVRWLFDVYDAPRVRQFVRQHGERWLSKVAFNYWRKLLRVRRWQRSSLPTPRGELWQL
jgi:hypothetical protein